MLRRGRFDETGRVWLASDGKEAETSDTERLNRELELANAALRAENERMKRELDEMTVQASTAQQELAATRHERDDLRAKLAEAEKSLRGSAETRGTREFHIARELDRLRAENAELCECNEQMRADLVTETAPIRILEAELAKLRELCGRAAGAVPMFDGGRDSELWASLKAAAKGEP